MMMTYFDSFSSELYIKGDLVLETALHIGGGNTDPYGVDNAVIKTKDGMPFIPGSSLKGNVRSFLERLSNAGVLQYSGEIDACTSGQDTMCLNELQRKKDRDAKIRELGSEKFQEYVDKHSCPICQLFGNQLRAAKVQISDAMLIGDWDGQFEYRNGVRINRDTGKAEGGALFDIEVVPAGNVFQFNVRGTNLSELEERWLLIALEALRQGQLTIGGKIAKGLGNVRGENWKYKRIDKSNFLSSLINNSMPKDSDEENDDDYIPYSQVLADKFAIEGGK